MLTLLSVFAAWDQPACSAGKPVYLTTIPPIADLLRKIVEGRGEVVALLPGGASPHTYEPRPSDLRAAATARAIVFVDRRLDGWAAGLSGPEKVPLLPMLPDSLALWFDDDEAEGDHGGRGDHHHTGKDPHFWTDPLAVRAVLPALAARLGEIDPAGGEIYRANAELFTARLDSIHREMTVRTEEIRGRSVLLSHPFLRYWLKRYGLSVAGIIEEIPGKEPTAKDLVRMIGIAGREDVRAILAQPQLSKRAAELIAESAGINLVVVDPLGGVPGRETWEEIVMAIAESVTGGVR